MRVRVRIRVRPPAHLRHLVEIELAQQDEEECAWGQAHAQGEGQAFKVSGRGGGCRVRGSASGPRSGVRLGLGSGWGSDEE